MNDKQQKLFKETKILNTGRIRKIKPEGFKNAKYVFVGDCPPQGEFSSNKLFSSSYYNTLNTLLMKAGIRRDDCYFTYLFKERPFNGDLSPYIRISKHKIYESEQFRNAQAALKEELADTTANVLVPVGKEALYALTGKDNELNWRGSVIESTLLPGRKTISILHPETVTKKYIYQRLVLMDLNKINKNSSFPEVNLKSRVYKLAPTFYEVMGYLKECESLPEIAFDIEIANFELSCFSIAKTPYEVMSIPLIDNKGEYFNIDREKEILLQFAKLLENPNQRHIGQNIIFDAFFLYDKYGIRTTNLEDSMIAQAICYPDYPKDLGFLTSLYTDLPYYKSEGEKGFTQYGIDKNFWLYNAKDSIVAMEAFEKLKMELAAQNNFATYRRQVDIIYQLMYVQARGIKIDTEHMQLINNETEEELKLIKKKIHERVGYDINPNSPKQLIQYFYEERNYKSYRGKKSTDEKTLKRFITQGDKVASLVLNYRKLSKLKGTYYDMTLDPRDGRFRTSYKPAGTVNGRLSSSKTLQGIGGNAQNIPKSVKKYMLVDEGYMGYEIDLSQAENRIVAYIAPEPFMINAFENGIDIHRQTASLLFNIPFNEVSNEPGSSDIGNGTRSQRYWGKTSNHSLNYDLGYRSYAMRFELGLQEAKAIVERYHKIYPGIHKYHAWVREHLMLNNRKLTNLLGRTRVFLDRWEDHLFKEAYNFIPQSTVADMINEFGILHIERNPKLKEVELLNQIHDSIVIQIPKKLGLKKHAHILKILIEKLQTPLTFRGYTFSIPAEIKYGLNFGEMHDCTIETIANSQSFDDMIALLK
jgi:uracil-DNA glycosylase family 4